MADQSKQIRALNDQFRKGDVSIPGQTLMTVGVQDLINQKPETRLGELISAIQGFDDFTDDNDPYGEHDFGALDFHGQKLFWKFDYYAPDMMHGAEDPTNLANYRSDSHHHAGRRILMEVEDKRELTQTDKIMIFKQATASLPRRFASQISQGITDDELETILQDILGIFGGSGGPDRPSIAFKGSGLKIWGGWHTVNHVQEIPLFAGKATIAMAREIYKIPNSSDKQMKLL